MQRLPDPHGLIARIRTRLNKKCGVRQSPFCDVIISMRMQGVPFRDIEAWLIEQGPHFRISAPTLCKNFKTAKMEVKLTYAEEMLERMGGVINLDLVREASQNIITQKERVDRLVRRERVIQTEGTGDGPNPAYLDKRIRGEMDLLNTMIRQLHYMLEKTPDAVRREAKETLNAMENQDLKLTDDAAKVITDMIINDELLVGPSELLPSGQTRH